MLRFGMGLLWLGLLSLLYQWNGILRIGLVFPLSVQDFDMASSGGFGVWLQVVEGFHRGLSEFIHGVVVHRKEAIRVWRNWLREDPLVQPYRYLRPDLVPPAPFFCSVIVSSLLVVLEFWLIPAGLMRNSVKLGFPTFAVLGKGRPVLRNSLVRLMGGSLFCRRFPCLVLLERYLLEWFIVKVLLLVVWMAGVGVNSRLSRFLGLTVLLVFFPG